MTRVVVPGGGFAGKQIQVATDWSPTRVFPRDSATMRPASRCPVCRRLAGRSEREAA